jgi:hypothetical protein
MDDDDGELLEQKKFKCNKCKKEMKEKNFPYHLLSEHKIIPEKQKESSIRLYIKKKIETIKNMYVDISDIKNYKTEKGENLTHLCHRFQKIHYLLKILHKIHYINQVILLVLIY